MESIDGLHTGAIQTLFGQTIRANEPVELMVCHYEALWAREAIRRAGKPGLCLEGIMSGASSEVQNAGDFPGGLRPSDLHIVAFSNELKVNWYDLKKIIHNQNRGNLIEACTIPVLGGYCGGPEGTVITAIAEIMQGFVMARPVSFASGITALRFGGSNRQTIWANCMLPLAFNAAGVDIVLALYVDDSAGPCTEMLCDELAAQVIAETASGVSIIYGAVGNQGATLDHATGMESRIVCEVSRAAVGIDLSEADRIAKALLGKYEETLKSGQIPQGKSFRECYQLDLKPSHEYLDIWLKQKEELNELIKYNT
jgi:methylamine--corrinoid protein Co-methyltransferase